MAGADTSFPRKDISCQCSKPSYLSFLVPSLLLPRPQAVRGLKPHILSPCSLCAIFLNREVGVTAILDSDGCNEMTQVRDSEQ